METQVANYRIIIESEIQSGHKVYNRETTSRSLSLARYNAYCPTLQVSDYGDSIEEVMISIKDGINLAIEALMEAGKEIPSDNLENQVIAST